MEPDRVYLSQHVLRIAARAVRTVRQTVIRERLILNAALATAAILLAAACAGESKPEILDIGQGELAALASSLRQHAADLAVSGERIRVIGEQMHMEAWIGYGTRMTEDADAIGAIADDLAIVADSQALYPKPLSSADLFRLKAEGQKLQRDGEELVSRSQAMQEFAETLRQDPQAMGELLAGADLMEERSALVAENGRRVAATGEFLVKEAETLARSLGFELSGD